LNANVLFLQVFKNLTLCMTKHRVLVLCFSYFTDTSNIGQGLWKLRIAGKFVAEGECNGAIMDIFLSHAFPLCMQWSLA
jgi:hypothetical protein